ncbi:pilus assembly protein PilP [Thermodesulfobacteriota bacterium]
MRRLQIISRNSLFLLSIFVFITLDMGLAAQREVINKDKKPQKSALETKKPGAEKEQVFLYDPTGKTDPFQSFIVVREEKAKKEKRKPRTELEALELSQLGLVLIVVSPKGRWAMVKDSKDKGYVIKEGTPIGTNGGIVYKIKPGEVIIREEFKDFRGRTKHREIAKKPPSLR